MTAHPNPTVDTTAGTTVDTTATTSIPVTRVIARGHRTWSRLLRVRRNVWFGGAAGAVVIAALTTLAIGAPVPVAAALVTGFFNTAGGGGAVVTFLALSATGVPALTAHATSQVVTPVSFLAGSRPNHQHWPGRRPMLAGCLGAVCGVAILTITPPHVVQAAAPWCLVPAAVLVATQEPVRRVIRTTGWSLGALPTVAVTFACGVYAGLIGIGTGTLAIAALGLTPAFIRTPLRDLLRTRNVLLLAMALLVSIAFALTGLADWRLVATMLLPAAVGGWLGTKAVNHLSIPILQAMIVATALAGTGWMWTRQP